MQTEPVSEEPSKLESRINELELKLLRQEHRPLRVFYNLWSYRKDPTRHPATVWALFSWIFSPGVVATVGVSVVGVLGVVLAYQANSIITEQNNLIQDQVVKMQEQNQLLIEQNQAALEEQRSNLYFQRLDRRTYMLSVLYDVSETARVRREALNEFLRLDRELKQTEVRNDPKLYRQLEEALRDNSGSAEDWHRWVMQFPKLRTDLSDVVLRGMNLQFLNFSDTVLAGADLSCSNLEFANLSNADLTGVKLVGATLEGAELNNATATAVDLSGARLNGASLRHTWLADATFDFAFLWKTEFGGYRNSKQPPKSAKRAFIQDLYDMNESGGAEQFERWARTNGATTESNYDEWHRRIVRDEEMGRITIGCSGVR